MQDTEHKCRIRHAFHLDIHLQSGELCERRMHSYCNMSNYLKYKIKIRKPLLLADIISAILLLLFLYSSLSKLVDRTLFKAVLLASPLLKYVAGSIVWLLPIAEIVVAILLFIPSTRVKGLYGSLMLISIFTAYLIYMIFVTPHLPCNCGGVLKSLTWKQHIYFNLFSIILSASGIFLYQKNSGRLQYPP